MTKNKRDIERTEKQIIEAAAVEFAENGFKGARVDAIAKRAGINKAMIYYIFGGKERLHIAVLKNMIEAKTKNVFEKISNGNVDLTDLLQIIDTYFDDLTDVKEYSKIILDDLSTGAKALQKLKKESPDLFSIFELVSSVIQKFIDQGVAYPLDPYKSVLSVTMLMISFTCIQPYMDLIVPEGSEEHKNMSDPIKWKEFFLSAISNIFIQQPK